VCMNRIHHLQQTLPQNIADNRDYPNVEFVVLDYNSSDGLEEWIVDEMSEYIKSGVLKYYKTTEPEYFDRSHSRNVLFKLADGDILCNLDADNYTGKGFATYINNVFNAHENIYLVADTKKRLYFLRNAFGRFCVKKSDFMALRGLDEKMKSYGSETVDFYERLEMAGKKEVVIENTHFLKTISHGDEERISNEFFLKSLKQFFIRYISTEESEILFLYKDNTFENAIIVPDNVNAHLPASLKKRNLGKRNLYGSL
jgi:glycosyltransferase involved in cell wall biosynthesis